MLFVLLLVINLLVCVALVGVVLLQQSEGGALGMGGGPSGFMTARGAGDLLTRSTWILASVFIGLSLVLSILQAHDLKAANAIDAKAVGRINLDSLKAPASPTAVTAAPARAAPTTTASAPITLQAPPPSLGVGPAAPPAAPATK